MKYDDWPWWRKNKHVQVGRNAKILQPGPKWHLNTMDSPQWWYHNSDRVYKTWKQGWKGQKSTINHRIWLFEQTGMTICVEKDGQPANLQFQISRMMNPRLSIVNTRECNDWWARNILIVLRESGVTLNDRKHELDRCVFVTDWPGDCSEGRWKTRMSGCDIQHGQNADNGGE